MIDDDTPIKNKIEKKPQKNLQKMRQDALDIFYAGVQAVDPITCIPQYCSLQDNQLIVKNKGYDLGKYEQIIVLGAGKASAAMALALEHILGDRITKGLIIVKYDHGESLKKIDVVEAAHPVPDKNGLKAAQQILDLAGQSNDKTLVICLISGGGSALMTLPVNQITLKDKQETTTTLLRCGATIHEINTIRKHLSQIKGGQLARAVYPSDMICLVLSDVVGDDLSTIASGPAVPDPGTFNQCLDIIQKYQIKDQIPATVFQHLTNGKNSTIQETPKPGDPVFKSTTHTIIADNISALRMARKKATTLGYTALLLSSMMEGEASQVAKVHTAIAKEILVTGHPVAPPACILSGGETTVTIKGSGKGGRNLEFALACALDISDLENMVILSGGTDGTDGPTDAAGAILDGHSRNRAKKLGLDPGHHLGNNNAYPFFDKIGDLIKTGSTRTNVMDIRIMLIR